MRAMTRRGFAHCAVGGMGAAALRGQGPAGFRLTEVTEASGIRFRHENGARGGKLLPETMGPGCAFIDYDNDGWQDIVLLDGRPLGAGAERGGREQSGIRLYRNNRNGTFTDVTRRAGLAVPMYALGVAVGDFQNSGFPSLYVTGVGQNRLFANQGDGTFRDVTVRSGLGRRQSFSTSAAWVDIDGDGYLDLFVCNYVDWRLERDIHCSVDGTAKSYCTPEAYRGSTCWLFRNRGDGTFEDVTVSAGIFDRTSKALGVAMLDANEDGWPDLFVANDTQPNKLYRNLGNGRFAERGLESGVALSEDGKARAGMGVDTAWLDGAERESVVVTNFENEMAALYTPTGEAGYSDRATAMGLGQGTRQSLGFGCCFFDADLDGSMDLLVANGHIDEAFAMARRRAPMAQPAQLFLQRKGGFIDVSSRLGDAFTRPRVARGAAIGDINNDGVPDLLLTENGGPARLYRNENLLGHRSIRITLKGTESNRSAIGAVVEAVVGGKKVRQRVKSGGSYLSQSELPLTIGLGKAGGACELVVRWPSGRVEEAKNVASGQYVFVEHKGLTRAG